MVAVVDLGDCSGAKFLPELLDAAPTMSKDCLRREPPPSEVVFYDVYYVAEALRFDVAVLGNAVHRSIASRSHAIVVTVLCIRSC